MKLFKFWTKNETVDDEDDFIDLNDKNAKVISRTYGKGNDPTERIFYECPCGRGRIGEERVHGFGDYSVWFECKRCGKKYKFATGCGYIWELEERD